jgi:hypothetical protein
MAEYRSDGSLNNGADVRRVRSPSSTLLLGELALSVDRVPSPTV